PELGRFARRQADTWLTISVSRPAYQRSLPMVVVTNGLQATNRTLVRARAFSDRRSVNAYRSVLKAIGSIGSNDAELVGLLLELGQLDDFHPVCHGALLSSNLLPAVRGAFPMARQSL